MGGPQRPTRAPGLQGRDRRRWSRSSREKGCTIVDPRATTSPHRLQRNAQGAHLPAGRRRTTSSTRSARRPACAGSLRADRLRLQVLPAERRDRPRVHPPARARPTTSSSSSSDGKYEFRKAGKADGATGRARRYGDQLLSFRPRGYHRPAGRGGRGRRLGPDGQAGDRQPAARPPRDDHERAGDHSARTVAGTFPAREGADRRPPRRDQRARPRRWPQTALDRRADALLRGRGRCIGQSRRCRAGCKRQAQGRRHAVRRHLPSSRRRRTSTAARRATRRRFAITGRSARGLLDLVHPPEKRDCSRHIVVGIVTNVNDPDKTRAREGQVPDAARPVDAAGEHLGARSRRSPPATTAAC